MKAIGFIGGGRITAVLLQGWHRAGRLPEKIIVSDTSSEVLDRLKAEFPEVETTPDNVRSAGQDFVFMALHPPAARAALTSLTGALKREAVVVSLAPVLRFEELSNRLGGFRRLARMIPNAPSTIGQGYNPTCYSADVGEPERRTLKLLFDPLGAHPEVPEEQLEAYAVLTAMGPTYLWHQWQVLRELGVDFGLSATDVDLGLLRMIEGAARMLLDTGLSGSEVMDTIPIKPLAESEAQIAAIYHDKLAPLYLKLKTASCEHLTNAGAGAAPAAGSEKKGD
jgi:pyrroline-5-carboxylate reductase